MRSTDVRVAVALLAATALVVSGCAGQTTAERQAEVAARGAEVMPFDLDATTHTFTKTDGGGVQSVTANDPADTAQEPRIRQHLRLEQANFTKGDFDDPARIHGMDMPGVSLLSARYHDIVVTYRDVPHGAELTYTTTDPALVQAIHEWFDRQLMDHGPHATAG